MNELLNLALEAHGGSRALGQGSVGQNGGFHYRSDLVDRAFHPDFDAAVYQLGLQSGITDTRALRVLPDVAQLCVVVRDPANANSGSVCLPLAQYRPDGFKGSRQK